MRVLAYCCGSILGYIVLAAIGSAMSNLGAESCTSAGPYYPYGCGTFWWIVGVVVLTVVCGVLSTDVRKLLKGLGRVLTKAQGKQ
jgi:hypothetical protein